MQDPAVLYQDQEFEAETHARWAVFLHTLGIQWTYRPSDAHLYGGDPYTPTFYLPDQGTYLEIADAPPAGTNQSPQEAQLVAAKLATGAQRTVILINGTVHDYVPCIFHAKYVLDPMILEWLRAIPEEMEEWYEASEVIVVPGRTFLPTHLAWVRQGVGLDFWEGELVVLACEPETARVQMQEPYWGRTIEVQHFKNLQYGAYTTHDPLEPAAFFGADENFEPEPEYLRAITKAKKARFTIKHDISRLN